MKNILSPTLPILLLLLTINSVYSNCIGQLIKRNQYSLCYSEEHEQAHWVKYQIDVSDFGSIKRTNDFREDPLITTQSATLADYKRSGYDRGHLTPASVNKSSRQAMSESFYMSNMSPQVPSFNRGIWKKLEAQVRNWVNDSNSLVVYTGAVLEADLPSIGSSEVSIPKYYFKAIYDTTAKGDRAIGFLMKNEKSKQPLQSFVVTIDSIESLVGYDLFEELGEIANSYEDLMESNLHLDRWDFSKRSSRRRTVVKKAITDNSSSKFECESDKKYCKHMSSCDEAMFYLNQCGRKRMDGDKDRVPCESLCR
jgi:endonuclease G, mitochondrial